MKKKVIEGKNYGSIPHLSGSKLGEHDRYIHEGQEKIIREGGRDKWDQVIVSLKLDGTNVGVVKKGGKCIALQRKGYDCASSPYRQHHEFNDWMYANYAMFDNLLGEGERIVGEWLWQASGIKYKIMGDPFFAFDFFEANGKRKPFSDLGALGRAFGFKVPMSLSFTRPNFNMLSGRSWPNPLTWKDSRIIPEDKHEGLVYRVERKGEFDFAAKWVRSDFIPGKYLPGVWGNGPELHQNEIV